MTVGEALVQAAQRLAPRSDSPRLDAELLLGGILDVSRGGLLARRERELDDVQGARFEHQLRRRLNGEPVAYLLGRWGFWTLDLEVTPDVLVPRPDTELLVEWSLALWPNGRPGRIADLGTGSGAIALAIASERPQADVLATDVSAAALAVARRNAMNLGLSNLRLAQGHWFDAVDGEYDLIVSNPPYIAADDQHLSALQHEPLSALTDHSDGLGCLREIVSKAQAFLRPGAWLLVEHGYDQGAAVRELFEHAGYCHVETRRDLGGNERVTGGCRPA